jgi:PAS domain S-box-containing protein
MTIRFRFLLVVSLIITVGIVLSSAVTYAVARRQLEEAARLEIERTATLLARQSGIWIDSFEADIRLLAESPLVQQTADSPFDQEFVAAASRYFRTVVDGAGVYQSINLVDREGRCVASSFPNRIGFAPMQRDIAADPDFSAALAGRSSVSPIVLSRGTGRPCIVLTVPVRICGRVAAVIRAALDLDDFNDRILRPEPCVHGGRACFFDPRLDTTLPEGWKVPNARGGRAYRPPEIPIPPEMLSQRKGFLRYPSKEGVRLAGFVRGPQPDWFFVVERPLRDVLAPVQAMGRITLAALAATLLAVSASVFLMAHPLLGRLGRCMAFAREISEGRLDRRLEEKGRDEIARLGRGLNAMAENLEKSRAALEEAEERYRGLFENAVEGIFVAGPDGVLLNANPALAGLLGCGSPGEIIGGNVADHCDPESGKALFAALEARDTVKDFDIRFHRRDGAPRRGSVYARAIRGGDGKILRIQGILDDVTDRRKAEEERRRAEETERRLVQSRLETLRYQINPHFLFNVLNTLDALSKKNPDRITKLVGRLARYLRSTLSPGDSGFVPLREELETMESYLALEEVRFEEDLAVSISMDPGILDLPVPELLLQPLVENAVKHGMKTSPMPLRIRVAGRAAGGRLFIEVANTGKWLPREKRPGERNGVGLENLEKRLDLAFAGRYRLTTGEAGGWVSMTVEIPVEREHHGTDS